MDGILRCSRYSFGPNRLHYCGPDANSELLLYIKNELPDRGLTAILSKFGTLFPYLRLIADANRISDPFDDRVVEAYWLGNELLDQVGIGRFYSHLVDVAKLKTRLGPKDFAWLERKMVKSALPHHSFHVFNVWIRTGHNERLHTLESMDACRVSCGEVVSVDGPNIVVKTEPLVYVDGKLKLGELVQKKLLRRLESHTDIEQLLPGSTVSIHWDVICEAITPRQAAALKKYTLQSIALANQTL